MYKIGKWCNKPVIDFLIVGLGNPDKKYENTRHNAGFMVIDKLAQDTGCNITQKKFLSLIGECSINGCRCILMKPQTYMNNSGEAVHAAMNFYKIDIKHVIVIYDDISLEPSFLRIRRKGTHGGHNGIKSILEHCGDENFPRVKIGVGKKPHPDYDLADWVLSVLKKDELTQVDKAAKDAVCAIKLILNDEIDTAMNMFN
ncbi:MAG: aminoacyl-tRNA hydrolase [Oscillospiraceae bacterium]